MIENSKYRLWGGILLLGTSLWGCGIKKVTVQKTPKISVVYTDNIQGFLSGHPAYAKPWIVFSAQNDMPVYASSKAVSADKKSQFLEPLVVLKKKDGRLKIAKYETGSIVDYKLDKELAQPIGWINEKDVLLWTASLSNEYNGFSIKGVLGIHDKSVIADSERFIENDSILVYTDPSLLHKTAFKLPMSSIVYLYKYTADKKRVLIGGQSRIEVDNPESKPYGWIDTRMLGIWGERTALRMKSTAEINAPQIGVETQGQLPGFFTPISSSSRIDKQDIGSIFPLFYHKKTDHFDLRYFDHQLDYSENLVYNVTGKPLTQPVYQSIVKNNKKLNLIFIVDGSNESKAHLPLLKAMFQGINPPTYFDEVTYSTLFYRVNKVNKSFYDQYRCDFDAWNKTFSDPLQMHASAEPLVSLVDCMEDMSQLLDCKYNNLIVILGQDISTQDQEQKTEIIQQIVAAHGRLIFYQVNANYNDRYNDFVLFGEEIIKASADQLVPYKKQRLIFNQDVVEGNSFDLSQGDQGLYQLEYPKQSMHQGAVIFPKKGEENKPLLLQTTFERMMHDIALDNQKIDSTLTAAFQSRLGVGRTKIKSAYLPLFQQEQTYVPTNLAQQLVNYPYTFLHPGILKKEEIEDYDQLEYGVLLNEEEVEQLRNYYISVYDHVFKTKNLSNKNMIRNYVRATRENLLPPIKLPKTFLYNNPLFISFFQKTGLYQTTIDSLSHLPLKSWKKERVMNQEILKDFFINFKIKAEKINEHKGDQNVLLPQHQSSFYWFNQAFIPALDFSSKKTQEQSFDGFPIELEKTEIQDIRSESSAKHAREYLERVKRGMP